MVQFDVALTGKHLLDRRPDNWLIIDQQNRDFVGVIVGTQQKVFVKEALFHFCVD